MAYFKSLLYTLISIILLGCGASHHVRVNNIYQDQDFTYDALKKDGMIIAGISSQIIPLTDEERIQYSLEISNILLEELKDAHELPVINTKQCITIMGKENYFQMMHTYDYELAVMPEAYTLLRDSMPDNRYMLLAYIENENIIDNSYEVPVEKEDGEKEIETEYKKTYLLSIDFRLYDLQQKEMVWNSVIFNEADRTDSRTTRSGCFESAIDGLFQNILFGEAAEIEREEVLAKIAGKLADDLEKTK